MPKQIINDITGAVPPLPVFCLFPAILCSIRLTNRFSTQPRLSSQTEAYTYLEASDAMQNTTSSVVYKTRPYVPILL